MDASKAIEILQGQFPKIDGICLGSEMGYSEDSIFLGDCAEGGTIDGDYACNYFGFESDPKEKIWVMGIHRKLEACLNGCGFFAECHDAGTYLAYRI